LFGSSWGLRLPLRPLLSAASAAVVEVAEQLLLLGIDRDRRLSVVMTRPDEGVDSCKLGIAVRVAGAFAGLAIGLDVVAAVAKQAGDG
jgi:hypothetical protein